MLISARKGVSHSRAVHDRRVKHGTGVPNGCRYGLPLPCRLLCSADSHRANRLRLTPKSE